MKILVHDYAGHPFTAELSRKLAHFGHQVSHTFFGADSGPKGRLTHEVGDPEFLSFHSLDTRSEYSKKNFIKRRFGDVEYGKVLAAHIQDWSPDIVISGNAPTEVQEACLTMSKRVGAKFVYWCQDFYSIAVDELVRKKIPVFGALVGAWYKHLDKTQMERSDHIVLITEGFRQQTSKWRIPAEKISVIPNWGVLNEISLLTQDNPWSREHGLAGRSVCLYSGTLARKHDPFLLWQLASETEANVVVVSAGVGFDELKKLQDAAPKGNLILLPLQPFERFSEVLSTASVFVGVLEEEAGQFSVPSKVLSYLCANKPTVLSAPLENLASEIIKTTGAGKVVAPGQREEFIQSVAYYLEHPVDAEKAGAAGRAYAEQHFDLDKVGRRFEDIFKRLN
ncbi:glycosyltransferase family 4 protein [Ponticaulis sp.]|uniref:glycosyltransferase family 4 protein n=1 Tax=Ponticaulis sp. TaxID=2020902 RepID=UPI000B75DADE|nr:glycosyltransferase family 4 protein [Ponticaulis sp.]MAJ07530.1 glycosyltransferase WbuB [Ponticaulis sp.]RPG17761.1 MAG: glycosyltransferase WbuB [Hyphomonadaceae bacterium TMED125]HBJ93469.1 glycosyltransferase WbuB [Hyphomonadaceae bacterium]|tara:strand:- start:17754 stop:18935 length:1182 start_codon:yes stop_codon:yes gene_type:complete